MCREDWCLPILVAVLIGWSLWCLRAPIVLTGDGTTDAKTAHRPTEGDHDADRDRP